MEYYLYNIPYENGVLTLGGIQFKIPTGFNEVESEQDVSTAGDAEHIDGTTVDTEVSADFAQGTQKLDIKVGLKNNGKIDTLNLPVYRKKPSTVKTDTSGPKQTKKEQNTTLNTSKTEK